MATLCQVLVMQEIEFLERNKRSKLYSVVAMLCAVLLLVGSVVSLHASSTQEQLNQAQQQANQMQQQLNEQKENLNKLEREREAINKQIKDLNAKLTKAVAELNDTEFAITAKELEIAEKQKELTKAKEVEDKQYRDLISHMQYMYESGLTQSYLNLMSKATSWSDFLNLSEYVEQISAYDVQMLKQFKAIREFVEAEELVLETEHAELQALKEQQEAKKKEVDRLMANAQTELKDKLSQISAKEDEITAEEEALASIKGNIAELQRKLAEELKLSQEAANAAWRDISQVQFEANDKKLLANLIYCEARGESYAGKLAVGAVVVNRILSSKYPSSMTGVIYQKSQFAPATSTKNSLNEALALDKASWPGGAGCYKAAEEAMSGITNVENCLYFQTISYLEKLGRLHVVRYTIGNHGFY